MSEPTSSGDKSMHDSDSDVSALYASSRKETPPPHLDDRILQAARAALPVKKPADSHRSLPWLTGLAASVVVGILLVQLYPDSQPEQVIAQADLQQSRSLEAPVREEAKAKNSYDAAPSVAGMAAAPAEKRLLADRAVSETEMSEADSAMDHAAGDEAIKAYTRLIELYKAGKLDAAIKAYRDFKEQYPHFEVPVADQTLWQELQKHAHDPE